MNSKINFLNAEQVSDYLKIPIRTVQDLSQKGKIRAIKIGNKWRYAKEDIEKYFLFGTNFSREPDRKQGGYNERRAYPRINSNLKCDYSIDLSPYKNINDIGMIKNISAGGVLLSDIKDGIDIDDPINLGFEITYGERKINISTKGRVVRKTLKGVGVKFRDMPAPMDRGESGRHDVRNMITEYVG